MQTLETISERIKATQLEIESTKRCGSVVYQKLWHETGPSSGYYTEAEVRHLHANHPSRFINLEKPELPTTPQTPKQPTTGSQNPFDEFIK